MAILGITLILIGIVLAVAEAHAPGGVLGVLGGAGLAVGGVLVIVAAGGGAILAVPVAAGLAVASGGWVLVITRKAAIAHRRRVRSGPDALCGSVGVVRRWSESAGQVFVGGALWRARRSSSDEPDAPLCDGDQIVVERVDGLTLSVRPAEEWELIG
jgi:membrane-bound ClpP family serine protease